MNQTGKGRVKYLCACLWCLLSAHFRVIEAWGHRDMSIDITIWYIVWQYIRHMLPSVILNFHLHFVLLQGWMWTQILDSLKFWVRGLWPQQRRTGAVHCCMTHNHIVLTLYSVKLFSFLWRGASEYAKHWHLLMILDSQGERRDGVELLYSVEIGSVFFRLAG